MCGYGRFPTQTHKITIVQLIKRGDLIEIVRTLQVQFNIKSLPFIDNSCKI